MRDGYGADIVVDTAGVSAALKLSMDMVRPCGQINKIGWAQTRRFFLRSSHFESGYYEFHVQP